MEKLTRSEITIIGHRGSGSGQRRNGGPENSIESFRHALAHGADEVECDLALTRDGQVCIYHDPQIKTGFFRRKPLDQLTLAEICHRDPNVVSLADLLAEFPTAKFIFELKSYTPMNEIMDRIYEPFIKPDPTRFRFISFMIDGLAYVKKLDSKLYCSYIATCRVERFEPLLRPQHIAQCLDHGLEEITGHWLGIRPSMIAMARQAGLTVGIGFVDSARILNYSLTQGVSRLYSDDVVKLIENFDEWSRS